MSRLDDINLKKQILTIIRTDTALNMVNFSAGQFVIGTMHFHILSGYIDIGRCHCSVNPTGVLKGAAAEYVAGSNTIMAKDSRIQFIDDKISLVHEATHAVIDLLGGFNRNMTVTSLETETCAYIAGAMYKQATLRIRAKYNVLTRVLKDAELIEFVEYAPQFDEADMARLTRRGAQAWKDVADATAWVDELRGSGD